MLEPFGGPGSFQELRRPTFVVGGVPSLPPQRFEARRINEMKMERCPLPQHALSISGPSLAGPLVAKPFQLFRRTPNGLRHRCSQSLKTRALVRHSTRKHSRNTRAPQVQCVPGSSSRQYNRTLAARVPRPSKLKHCSAQAARSRSQPKHRPDAQQEDDDEGVQDPIDRSDVADATPGRHAAKGSPNGHARRHEQEADPQREPDCPSEAGTPRHSSPDFGD